MYDKTHCGIIKWLASTNKNKWKKKKRKYWKVFFRLLHPWDFPGKNTGVGCHFLLQGIFPTQGSNLVFLHYRRIPPPTEPPYLLNEYVTLGTESPLIRVKNVKVVTTIMFTKHLTCGCHVSKNFITSFIHHSRNRASPGGLEGKASACNVRDPGLIPESGRPPGEGNGTPLQYSCLENPLDGGAW